jgi:hypothetical protein
MAPGEYVLRVSAVQWKEGRNSNMVIVETEVLASSYDATDPSTHESNREGTHPSIFIKEGDAFLSNMKEFICAASGFDQAGNCRPFSSTVDEAEAAAILGPDQPMAGAFVFVRAFEAKTRAGGTFTRINYLPVPVKGDGTPDLEAFQESRDEIDRAMHA